MAETGEWVTNMVKNKNVNIIIFSFYFLNLIFFQLNSSFAQIKLSLNQTSSYDQNIFRNNQQISDWVHQTSVSVLKNFDIKSTSLKIGYSGNLIAFHEFHEKFFHIHQLGIEYSLPFFFNSNFTLGTNYLQRINKSEYNIYDFIDKQFYLQLHSIFPTNSPLELGYQFRSKEFSHLDILSYNEQAFFLRIKHFFQTRTTLNAEINWGNKNYTTAQTFEEMFIIEKPNIDYGHGRQNGKGPGENTTSADTSIIAFNISAPETYQWSLFLKLAQSITSTTGLSIDFIKYFEPTEKSRYLIGQEYGYFKDDELYDDPYTYGSNEWNITLTQLLPWSCQMKLFYNYAIKTYSYTIDDQYRKDIQKLTGLLLNKRFLLSSKLPTISIYLSYNYLINNSNDIYFDYDSPLINAGLDIKL